jgi:hypothetical protein
MAMAKATAHTSTMAQQDSSSAAGNGESNAKDANARRLLRATLIRLNDLLQSYDEGQGGGASVDGETASCKLGTSFTGVWTNESSTCADRETIHGEFCSTTIIRHAITTCWFVCLQANENVKLSCLGCPSYFHVIMDCNFMFCFVVQSQVLVGLFGG